MGLAFLGDLARQRSLASAALLFLVLVDEIEGMAFLALGPVAHRADLFLASQDWLFPAVVVLAGALSLVRNWRRPKAQVAADPMEMLDAAMLSVRIGDLRPGLASIAPNLSGLSTSPYARSPARTSQRG